MAWVKLDDLFPEHPKVLKVGPLAAWLHVCGMAYCARNLTNGKIPRARLRGLADMDNPEREAKRLIKAGLWGRTPDGYYIHDYLEYQPSREQVEDRKAEISDKRSAAGKRGAKARWDGKDGKGDGKALATPKQTEWQTDGPIPSPSSSNDEDVPGSTKTTAEERSDNPEYHRLAKLLAELIEANGIDPPKTTQFAGWRNDVRLMVEQDDHDVAQIERAIRWAQASPFWRANILSMGKLREKYTTLQAQAMRDRPARSSEAPVNRDGSQTRGGGLLSRRSTCKKCPTPIDVGQANNQSGLCDSCYASLVEGAA